MGRISTALRLVGRYCKEADFLSYVKVNADCFM